MSSSSASSGGGFGGSVCFSLNASKLCASNRAPSLFPISNATRPQFGHSASPSGSVSSISIQMIFIDPPYGINYDSNFQQRVDSTKNDERDQADDFCQLKPFAIPGP
jgi:hypothetical protein